jgi:hypothetical protein
MVGKLSSKKVIVWLFGPVSSASMVYPGWSFLIHEGEIACGVACEIGEIVDSHFTRLYSSR